MRFTQFSTQGLTLGLVAVLAAGNNLETASASPEVQALRQVPNATAAIASHDIQIYGEVPYANQIQSSYVIFLETDHQVIGAYYQPYSEFSCFQGERHQQQLDVDVLSGQGKTLAETQISLAQLHSLPQASRMDQHILRTCVQEMTAAESITVTASPD